MPAWSKALATVLAGWLLTAVLAEVGFRLAGDQPSLDLAGLYTAFGTDSYKLAPHVDTSAALPTGPMSVHTDALGLRCDAARVFAVSPGAPLDVLLLGDSQGFGNGLSFPDSLAGAAALAAAPAGIRLANAAVGGHSAASQLQLAGWLHRTGRITPAHYVLLVTPAIAQSGGHLARAHVGPDGRLYGRAPDPLTRARLWAKTHLVMYPRLRDAARQGGLGGAAATDAPFVFSFYRTDAEERLSATFTDYVAQLRQFAATHGARVHLVYVPLTLELEFEPVRHSAAAHGLTLDRDVPLRVARAAAAACGVSFADLRPVLETLHARGAALHLPGDFHYDAELSRAAGARLWETLRPAVTATAPLVSLQR